MSALLTFSAFGVVLFGLVATHSLPASLASYAPDTALLLSTTAPEALLAKALAMRSELQATLNTTIDGEELSTGSVRQPRAERATTKPGERAPHAATTGAVLSPYSSDDPAIIEERQRLRAGIGEFARRMLEVDPLNSLARRLLGEAATSTSAEQELFRKAVAVSRQETFALYRLLNMTIAEKRYDEALLYADLLIRTRPPIKLYVFAHLASIIDDPAARDELIKLLKPELAWREEFLKLFPRYIKRAGPAVELMVGLKQAGIGPTEDEIGPLLEVLVENKFVELAYGVWVQMQPPEKVGRLGLLVNPSFEDPPSQSPFNWLLRDAVHAVTELVEREDKLKRRALRVTFLPGRGNYTGATQTVMLASGKYQLTGVMRGDVVAKRGLKWSMRCRYGKKQMIALSEPLDGSNEEWRRFTFDFDLPEMEDCNAQLLQLVLDARSPSEQLARGDMLIDELSLVRTGDYVPTDGATDGGSSDGRASQQDGAPRILGRAPDGSSGRFVPE